MATLSDSEALLTVGQILAGFLKEHLPPDERWTRFIEPALANATNPPRIEVALDQLDLSALLQVFLGNREYLRSCNVFRTPLPFNCAVCVRSMRNSRAHQSYVNTISDDERLFDLNLLRRFTLFIDNRATEPGLIDEFLAALDATIVEISNRCFGNALMAEHPPGTPVEKASRPISPIDEKELACLMGEVLEQVKSGFDHLGSRLERIQSLVSQDGPLSMRLQEDLAHQLRAVPTAPDAIGPMVDQLNAIDTKIDRLLGTAGTGPLEVQPEALAAETHPEIELLSGLEAKAALRSLRAQLAAEFPETDPTHALLRQTMVDLFLANRIDSPEKFEAVIPEIMHRDTDPNQLVKLPLVFGIVKRLR